MSEPTIYFPDNIFYKMGFTQGRSWSTVRSPSPSGHFQKRKQWIRPKRNIQMTIYPNPVRGSVASTDGGTRSNSPIIGPNTLTKDDVMGFSIMKFLDDVAGSFNNFYVFNPRERYLYRHLTGHWNGGGLPLPITYPGDLPYSFDFRGGSLVESGIWGYHVFDFAIAVVEVLYLDAVGGAGPNYVYTAPDLALSAGGVARETILTAITPVSLPAPDTGDYYVRASVSHASERIAAEMTSDQEQYLYDWAAAQPDTEIVIDLEESFG